MTRQYLRLVALGLSLALFALTAFADGYSLNPAWLVGRWKHEGPMRSSIVVLAADGTWTASITAHGSSDSPIQVGGTWRTDGKYVHWLYTTASSNSKAKPGTRDRDMLLEIGENRFVLENNSKQRQEYVRVK